MSCGVWRIWIVCVVLVHSENHIKITDFGLAKLMNENSKFHAEGEKVFDNLIVIDLFTSVTSLQAS